MLICGNERLYTCNMFWRRDMIVKKKKKLKKEVKRWRNEGVLDNFFWKGACEQTSFLLGF